jgi:hypothetical protein
VNLDGRYDYEDVKENLEAWYAKVIPGGIVCDLDYLDKTIRETVFGVKKAVNE